MYRKNLQDQAPVYNDGYTKLGNAIIIQAVKDYRSALKKLKKHPGNDTAKYTKNEVERFFRSELYSALTSVDCEFLIKKLQQEVKNA